jgi:hypothetical protein
MKAKEHLVENVSNVEFGSLSERMALRYQNNARFGAERQGPDARIGRRSGSDRDVRLLEP